MNRKKVLFVDDEAQILDGLRNLLRKQRHAWDMGFALGGQAALAELEQSPYDVIVSDMRMPGMDGTELLQRVKAMHPRMVRIVLSGHAEPEAILKTVPVAHQFLSKPCDVELLRTVIARTCNLQALLEDDGLRQVVGQLDSLPSAPRLYIELKRAMERPDVTLAEIAAIIECDPAMSVKVLQLVNSSYFGLGQRVASAQQAVMRLGIEIVTGLMVVSHVFKSVEETWVDGAFIDQVQQHSLVTARLAKQIVTERKLADEAFTAAVVHDIGEVVLAFAFPERFAEALNIAKEQGLPLHEIEQQMFGTTHADVGAYLLGVWGLPFPIVETAAYHHRPCEVPGDAQHVLVAVHVADALAHPICERLAGTAGSDRLDRSFLDKAGVVDRLPGWRTLAAETLPVTMPA